MSFTIKIEPEARVDIQEGINWYNKLEPGLGKRFHEAVKICLDKLRINPYYQFRYENVRCLPMKKYTYMIHFTMEENKVVIQAVFSTHRDPGIWQERR